MNNEQRASLFFRLLSGAMLILAIGGHPSSYYNILRWVVAGTSLYSGLTLLNDQKTNWKWLFFIIGIIFNPITPIYLTRGSWQIIDFIVAIILLKSVHIDFKNK